MNLVNQPTTELILAQVIDRAPLTVPLQTPLQDAIALMNQDSKGCVLGVEGTQLIGILTAQDIIRLVADGKNWYGLKISNVMTQPVVTLTLSDAVTPLSAIALLQQHSIHHLPVLDPQRNLIGLITANDLLSNRCIRFTTVDIGEQAQFESERQVVEATLRMSEDRYRMLSEVSPVGIFRNEPSGYCTYVNERAMQLVGASLEGCLGANWLQTIHPDDRLMVSEHWPVLVAQTTIAPNTPHRFECRHLHPDGTVVWVLVNIVPEYDTTGSITGFIGTLTDISDRKRREANATFLAEMTEDLSRLSTTDEIMRTVGAKVGTYLNTSNCLFAEVNEAQDQAIVEYTWHTPETPNATEGYQLSDFITEELRQTARSGETLIIRDTQTDPRIDSDRYAALKIHAYVTVPFHCEGEWNYVFTVNDSVARDWREDEIELIREVTNRCFSRLERARVEAALRHNQEMFSALVENAPFGVYLIDAEFRLQQINQGSAAVFSNIDPLIGRDFAEILRIIWQEPFATEAIRRFRHTLATGESYYSPTIVEPRANIEASQAYDWQIHRITLPDSSYGVVCYFYDLSEIKRAEEIIHRTAQRDAFLVTLSDALRPLSAPVELQATATRIVGEYLGANRALYFEVRGSDYVIERDYVNGVGTLVGTYPIDAFSQSLVATLRAGRTVIQPDVSAEPSLSPDEKAAYAAIEIGAHVGIPLIKDGEFVAGLAVHMNQPRVWTQDEVTLAIEVAERTWAAVERARAETALHEGEQLLRLAMVGARAGSWDWELSTGKLTWSPETYHLHGLTPANGLPDYEGWYDQLLHPEDRAWVNAFVAQAIEQQKPELELEFRILHPQDGIRWLLSRGRLILNAQGEPIRLSGINLDITDRKQLELALQKKEEQLRLALELNGIGSWDWQIDSSNVSWNDNHFRVLGYQPGEVAPSYQNWRDRMHPDDLVPAEQKLKQSLESQTDYNAEFRIILDDGSIRWLASKGHGLYDALGQPVRMVGVEFDITDRKEAEAQQAFQSFLLNQVKNAVIATDLEGYITYWNQFAQQLYQLTPEDMGRSMLDITGPTQQEIAQQRIMSIQEYGTWEGELDVQRRDGSCFTAYLLDSLLRDPSGNSCGMVGISIDITAQKQLEAQFLRAQRLESLGTLASGIAHDLNNILTPILVFAQLLPVTLPPLNERNQQLLGMLDENAKRGADLVKQILTFARGVGGDRAPVQVKHLLREVEQVVHSTFPKSLTIALSIATRDLWLVSADATQLHQVFMNFCVNARDAMRQGGSLRITAENCVIDETYVRMHLDAKVGSYVMITFTDTGTGISPENIDRIFEPFFTTKAFGEGTGLGLSTASGIVRSHGGFVTVYSEVGKGTQFHVFLPAIEGSETPATPSQNTIAGQGELILVVDDEANIRESLKITLESLNYRVLIAKDGIEAIAYYVEHIETIHTVVMDMMMPEMDGLTAIQALQKINPQIKVIATSGLGDDYHHAVQSLGVETLLLKPFTTTQLLHSIQAQSQQ
jgi:PAS domain S-box-containing protein